MSFSWVKFVAVCSQKVLFWTTKHVPLPPLVLVCLMCTVSEVYCSLIPYARDETAVFGIISYKFVLSHVCAGSIWGQCFVSPRGNIFRPQWLVIFWPAINKSTNDDCSSTVFTVWAIVSANLGSNMPYLFFKLSCGDIYLLFSWGVVAGRDEWLLASNTVCQD